VRRCKTAIEGALNPLDGVRQAVVDIPTRVVVVEFDEARIVRAALGCRRSRTGLHRLSRDADAVSDTISSPISLEFAVEGMTCGSCCDESPARSGREPGVASRKRQFCHFDRARRAFRPAGQPDELCTAVQKLGYGLSPIEPGAPVQLGDEHEAASERAWLRRVIVGWPLALLVGYLAMFSGPLGQQNVVALAEFALTTPLQFYVGWPFLREPASLPVGSPPTWTR